MRANLAHNGFDPQSSPDDTQHFLDLLGCEFTFQTFGDKGGNTPPTILHGTLAQHLPTLRRLNAAGAGCFFTVAQTDGKGRKAANITRIRAVFIDLDGSPLQPVLDGPLPPHIVIETSPGKWHCYWLIDHCDLEHFGFIQKALATRFDGDAKVFDLPRVMRLPGFLHQKGKPFLSRIIQVEPGRYKLGEFLKAFNIRLPERKLAPEPTRAISVKRDDAGESEGSRLIDWHLEIIRNTESHRNDTPLAAYEGPIPPAPQPSQPANNAALDGEGF